MRSLQNRSHDHLTHKRGTSISKNTKISKLLKTMKSVSKQAASGISAGVILLYIATILPGNAVDITGDTVTGDLAVKGDSITINNNSTTKSLELRYNAAGNSTSFWQKSLGEWIWSYGTMPTDVMSLDANHTLNLYDLGASSVNPSITLDPGNPNSTPATPPSITVGGRKVITATSASNGSTSSLLLSGTLGGTGSIPAEGAGTRMMWYPEKAAFRAGTMDGIYVDSAWDDVNIGIASTAFGLQTWASGNYSFATGIESSATGYGAFAGGQSYAGTDFATALGCGSSAGGGQAPTALGSSNAYGNFATAVGMSNATNDFATAFGMSHAFEYGSTASGNSSAAGIFSTAFGGSLASGFASTALGYGSAVGNFSTAAGEYTVATSYATMAIGIYNEDRHNTIDPSSSISSWQGDGQHSVFEVGVGQNSNNRANALTVLQDGSVEVGKDATDGSVPFQVRSDGTVVLAKPQGDISMGAYE